MAFNLGWWAEPIFMTGNYPEQMRYNVSDVLRMWSIFTANFVVLYNFNETFMYLYSILNIELKKKKL